MKVIKYQFVSAEINHGTEEQPNIEQVLFDKAIPWSEANEEIAKREAYNGEYTTKDYVYSPEVYLAGWKEVE